MRNKIIILNFFYKYLQKKRIRRKMENIFTGGNCNPNGLQNSMAANPMKNLINNMVMGKSVAAVHNPHSRIIDPKMQTMNGAMGNIEATWAQSNIKILRKKA